MYVMGASKPSGYSGLSHLRYTDVLVNVSKYSTLIADGTAKQKKRLFYIKYSANGDFGH